MLLVLYVKTYGKCEFSGLYGKWMFNFVKSHQIIFQSVSDILHPTTNL